MQHAVDCIIRRLDQFWLWLGSTWGAFWFGVGVLTILFFMLATWPANAADLALGDSIALGTGEALGVPTIARQSMGSCWIMDQTPTGYFDHVVVSAGINDPPGPCLNAIRAHLRAGAVVWILPAAINRARASVAAVASLWGDRTVSYACAGGCTKYNFHPASYATVAAAVRTAWAAR